MLTVAIVGAGRSGRRHAYTYAKIKDCNLIAFVDNDEKAGHELASMMHIKAFPDIASMLTEMKPDILDICTPTYSHVEIAMEAIDHPLKALFIENPLARTVDECRGIIDACDIRTIGLYVGHLARYFPSYVAAWRQVSHGAVGESAVVRTSRGGPFPHSSNNWHSNLSLSGGVTLDLLTYDFDWLRWCFGDVERVFAKGLSGEWDPDHPMTKDYTLATIRFKSGILAHVEGSWADPSGYGMSFEIAGDKGLLEYNFNLPTSPPSEIRDEAGRRALMTDENIYFSLLSEYLHSIATGEQVKATPKDALEAVRIAEAALESIHTGNTIYL